MVWYFGPTGIMVHRFKVYTDRIHLAPYDIVVSEKDTIFEDKVSTYHNGVYFEFKAVKDKRGTVSAI